MAVRIHVIGAYGATDLEFRAALDSIGDNGLGSAKFRIGTSGRWMWANASVWHVGGTEIDDALSSLSVPALRVTSSDAILWTITLTRPGGDRFHGVHHFTQVGSVPDELDPTEDDHDDDFPEDDLDEVAGINRYIPELEFLWDAEEEVRIKAENAAEVAATVPGLDDYSEYGVQLPAAVIEEMKAKPHRAWHTAFLAQGRQIVDALDDYGFECDRVKLLDLLTEGPLTKIEADADVGNMPRFLESLGIEGVFLQDIDAGVDEAAAPDEVRPIEEVDWSHFSLGELSATITPLLTSCPMTEISGGPVEVSHAALLHLLVHLLAEKPVASVLLEFPTTVAQPGFHWRNLPSLELAHTDRSWRFFFASPPYWWHGVSERQELDNHDLMQSLGAPPDGTRIELTFLVEGLSERCHRYAGTFRNQRLELDHAYPPVSAGTLSDALALVEQVFDNGPIELLAEVEEQAVRRDYERSQGEPPRIRNGKIKPAYGSRDGVVRTLLFERFEEFSPWDIAEARARIEADWEEYEQLCQPADEEDDLADLEEATGDSAFDDMLRQLTAANERLREAKIVPHSDEVIYEGRTGQFLRRRCRIFRISRRTACRSTTPRWPHWGFAASVTSSAMRMSDRKSPAAMPVILRLCRFTASARKTTSWAGRPSATAWSVSTSQAERVSSTRTSKTAPRLSRHRSKQPRRNRTSASMSAAMKKSRSPNSGGSTRTASIGSRFIVTPCLWTTRHTMIRFGS